MSIGFRAVALKRAKMLMTLHRAPKRPHKKHKKNKQPQLEAALNPT